MKTFRFREVGIPKSRSRCVLIGLGADKVFHTDGQRIPRVIPEAIQVILGFRIYLSPKTFPAPESYIFESPIPEFRKPHTPTPTPTFTIARHYYHDQSSSLSTSRKAF